MKTMKQPRKDVLREQLALAAEEIIRLNTVIAEARAIADKIMATELERLRRARAPWWRRLLGRFA